MFPLPRILPDQPAPVRAKCANNSPCLAAAPKVVATENIFSVRFDFSFSICYISATWFFHFPPFETRPKMSTGNPYSASAYQPQQQFGAVPPKVPDYLAWSVLVTLCCCPPLGIAAIIFSVMANSAKNHGEYQSAIDHAGKAKICLWISFVIGVIWMTFYVISIIAHTHIPQ